MLYGLRSTYDKTPLLPGILTNGAIIVVYGDFPAYTLISNVSKKGDILRNIFQPFTLNGVG